MTDNKKVVEIIKVMAEIIHENAQFLTDLDAAIGDSDHGINMDRGFKKVLEDLPGVADSDIGAILKKTGMDLVATVGGVRTEGIGDGSVNRSGSETGKKSRDARVGFGKTAAVPAVVLQKKLQQLRSRILVPVRKHIQA